MVKIENGILDFNFTKARELSQCLVEEQEIFDSKLSEIAMEYQLTVRKQAGKLKDLGILLPEKTILNVDNSDPFSTAPLIEKRRLLHLGKADNVKKYKPDTYLNFEISRTDFYMTEQGDIVSYDTGRYGYEKDKVIWKGLPVQLITDIELITSGKTALAKMNNLIVKELSNPKHFG